MPLDPDKARQLGQQGRLWLLSLVCAVVGAGVVSRTGALTPGVVAFLITLTVLGIPLWLYEKSRKRRAG